MRVFLLFLVAGAGAAVIGHKTGNGLAVVTGVSLVALTLLVGWLRRPHTLDRDGRWTCKNGHSAPASQLRCGMPGCGSRH